MPVCRQVAQGWVGRWQVPLLRRGLEPPGLVPRHGLSGYANARPDRSCSSQPACPAVPGACNAAGPSFRGLPGGRVHATTRRSSPVAGAHDAHLQGRRGHGQAGTQQLRARVEGSILRARRLLACLPALRPLGLPEPAAPPRPRPFCRSPSHQLLSANSSDRLSLSPASHTNGPAPFRLSANSSRRSFPAAPRLPLTARRSRPRSSSSRHPLHHLRPRSAARHAGTCSSDAEGL